MSTIKNLTDQDTSSLHSHINRKPSPEIIIQPPVNINNDDSSSYVLTKPSFTNLINKSDGEEFPTRRNNNSSLRFPTVNNHTNRHNASINKSFGAFDDIQYILDKSNPTIPPKTEESHILTTI